MRNIANKKSENGALLMYASPPRRYSAATIQSDQYFVSARIIVSGYETGNQEGMGQSFHQLAGSALSRVSIVLRRSAILRGVEPVFALRQET
jgi:hypothetical protein